MDDPAAQRPRPPFLALAAGFAVLYLVWGSTYLGIKYAIETLPPFLMAGGRFLLAGSILYLALRLRGAAAPTRRQWALGALTGALLLLGGNGLVTWGQQTVPSGRAALIVTTTPLWMAVLGWLFYRGGRPTGRVWLGLVAGLIGTALLIHPSLSEGGGSLLGTIAIMGAPLTWSVGSLESRRNPPTHDALLTSALQMLCGGALMALLGTALGEWPVLLTREISARSVAAFFYLAIFGGLVAFSTYAWLLRVAPPTAVTTYAYVNPLVAVLLGWLVAGEGLGWEVLLAAVLVIGGVVLITLPRSTGEKRLNHRDTESTEEAQRKPIKGKRAEAPQPS